MAQQKGRIAPGFEADTLIVDDDPTTDIDNLVRVRGVVLRGTPVSGRVATSAALMTS